MKYHKIASIEMLEAYRKGELSASDSVWIEQLIQKNPMVKAVAENISAINIGSVKSISRRTSKSISEVYFTGAGFWSKFGVWIGLSSVVIIIGLAFLYQNNNENAVYEKEIMHTELMTPEKMSSNQNFVAFAPISMDDERNKSAIPEKKNIDANNKKEITELSFSKNDKGNKTFHLDNLNHKNQQPDEESEVNNKKEDLNSVQSDNTRSFASKVTVAENSSVVLSVQNVQILAKTNPKDYKTKSSNSKSGSPLNTFGNKAGANGTYSMDDVPKFTGGDRALQDYFVGKLRPIKIKKGEDHYDRNVMIDLEINSHGKLKDYKIYGNLHPTHQKALIDAIKELPRFSKGSENVVYSIGISF